MNVPLASLYFLPPSLSLPNLDTSGCQWYTGCLFFINDRNQGHLQLLRLKVQPILRKTCLVSGEETSVPKLIKGWWNKWALQRMLMNYKQRQLRLFYDFIQLLYFLENVLVVLLLAWILSSSMKLKQARQVHMYSTFLTRQCTSWQI